jgi:hypothetical protein
MKAYFLMSASNRASKTNYDMFFLLFWNSSSRFVFLMVATVWSLRN